MHQIIVITYGVLVKTYSVRGSTYRKWCVIKRSLTFMWCVVVQLYEDAVLISNPLEHKAESTDNNTDKAHSGSVGTANDTIVGNSFGRSGRNTFKLSGGRGGPSGKSEHSSVYGRSASDSGIGDTGVELIIDSGSQCGGGGRSGRGRSGGSGCGCAKSA